jgi:hypothetical protein
MASGSLSRALATRCWAVGCVLKDMNSGSWSASCLRAYITKSDALGMTAGLCIKSVGSSTYVDGNGGVDPCLCQQQHSHLVRLVFMLPNQWQQHQD